LKRAVHWSADALRELDAAIAYIAARNPTAARRVIAELGIDRAGLGEILGIASGRVSEILNRRRRLTIELTRTVAMKLAISERCALRQYDLAAPATTVRGARVHA
jgi:antitoxin component HigA of HigAB toxin-antitoxin module